MRHPDPPPGSQPWPRTGRIRVLTAEGLDGETLHGAVSDGLHFVGARTGRWHAGMEQLTQHDPRRIGPFEVLGRLGAGGMGLVYLARSASGRRVAIKTVRTELAEDQLFRVRFTREVEAARAVSGFYTAAVVDADPRAAVPWLATAYVPAPSLEEIINECGPPARPGRPLARGGHRGGPCSPSTARGLVHRGPSSRPTCWSVEDGAPR
ncbi:serine/threonine protein kinase, partial [Streptomyces pristinaespiralis ATCC 25486]